MVGKNLLAFALALSIAGCGTSGGALTDLAPCALAPVGSDEVRAPVWAVGSEWQYSDGYGLKVTRVEGPVTTFERLDDRTQWVTRRGFLREDAQSGTTMRKLLYENLPSGAGQVLSVKTPLVYRREYMAGTTQLAHATSWTVEGRELVKVPAGQFDCIVLTMRTRNVDDGWTGYERWWFSPVAQNYVRMEYRYGPTSNGSRVLTSYRLGAGGAPIAAR